MTGARDEEVKLEDHASLAVATRRPRARSLLLPPTLLPWERHNNLFACESGLHYLCCPSFVCKHQTRRSSLPASLLLPLLSLSLPLSSIEHVSGTFCFCFFFASRRSSRLFQHVTHRDHRTSTRSERERERQAIRSPDQDDRRSLVYSIPRTLFRRTAAAARIENCLPADWHKIDFRAAAVAAGEQSRDRSEGQAADGGAQASVSDRKRHQRTQSAT